VWCGVLQYLSTYFFDYLGSVVNYAAVGAAILWMIHISKASSAQISGLVSGCHLGGVRMDDFFVTLARSLYGIRTVDHPPRFAYLSSTAHYPWVAHLCRDLVS
jgi:hypothetical protein